MAKQKKYTITKEQARKSNRRINREIEMEKNGSWTTNHKVHKSDKTYSRKDKHKKSHDYKA